MFLRRFVYGWQFAAAVALPLWVFLARGVFGAATGWDTVGIALAAPALGAALLLIAVITVIRRSVRAERAVSWWDVGVLLAWHASIALVCVQPSAWALVLASALGIVAFWSAVAQLVTDAARRVRQAVADFTVEFQSAVAAPRTVDLGELRQVDGMR